MTTYWRVFILAVAGLGAAWAVTQIGSGPPTVLNTLDDAGSAADAPPAPAEGAAPTEEDVQDQIRRAEDALGGKTSPTQELPVDPLRADVAIALPSDI